MNIFGFDINFLYGKKKQEYDTIESFKKELGNETYNNVINKNAISKLAKFLTENEDIGLQELISMTATICDSNKIQFLPIVFKKGKKVKYAVMKMVDEYEFAEELRNSL